MLSKDLKQFSTGVAIAFPVGDERDKLRMSVRRSAPPESMKRWTKLNGDQLHATGVIAFVTADLTHSVLRDMANASRCCTAKGIEYLSWKVVA